MAWRQAITYTNDDQVHWRMDASPTSMNYIYTTAVKKHMGRC